MFNFYQNYFPLRMASFCFQMVLWGSFDKFLSIFFKQIKILEKIMIFVYQHGAWVLVVNANSIKYYQKSSFFMIHLIFYDQHRSSKTFLFYSKHKLWIFPEILRPYPHFLLFLSKHEHNRKFHDFSG